MTAEFSPEVVAQLGHRSGGLCEVCGSARAIDKHHRRARQAGGTRRAESAAITNALHVCRECHNLLESRRNLATLLGWLVPSTFDPATQPVLYRGEWSRLTEDGDVEREERAA